ncbi:MAG: hypothetical protein AAFX78_14720 [Cyanobacteria bacterium J06638_20]
MPAKEITEVTRVPISEIIIHEMTREEMNIIKRGPSDSKLNIAIALFSLSIPTLLSLLVTNFPDDVTKGVFIVLGILFLLGGLIAAYLHTKENSPFHDTVNRIEQRYKEIEDERNRGANKKHSEPAAQS